MFQKCFISNQEKIGWERLKKQYKLVEYVPELSSDHRYLEDYGFEALWQYNVFSNKERDFYVISVVDRSNPSAIFKKLKN